MGGDMEPFDDRFNEEAYLAWESLFNTDGLIDLIGTVAPLVRKWKLHGRHFSKAEERAALLLAGQLKPFHAGVKVLKQKDKYFISYWDKGGTF